MIVHECEQGSREWIDLRLGIPTASQFYRIVTPARLNASSAQEKYRAEILAEWLLGGPIEWGTSGWMERGLDQEPEARKWYRFQNDVEVRQIGFVTTDDGLVGGSPDGIVGDMSGGVEIKVLSPTNHIQALLGGDVDGKHWLQVQGYLWLTGLPWWDLVYYHHQLPREVRRITPDPEFVEAFEREIGSFNERLKEDKERLAEHRVVRNYDPNQEAAYYMPDLP